MSRPLARIRGIAQITTRRAQPGRRDDREPGPKRRRPGRGGGRGRADGISAAASMSPSVKSERESAPMPEGQLG